MRTSSASHGSSIRRTKPEAPVPTLGWYGLLGAPDAHTSPLHLPSPPLTPTPSRRRAKVAASVRIYYMILKHLMNRVVHIARVGRGGLALSLVTSSSQLRRLRIAHCSRISVKALNEVAKKLPLLEELDISFDRLIKDSLEVIGRCCPLLKTLRICKRFFDADCDDEAFAIAKTMPGPRQLYISGNLMTNVGLVALLDGCPLLESLDLRECFQLDLSGSLEKRCCEQIKYLQLPMD